MNKKDLKLYFVYGSDQGDVERSLEVIRQALEAGITMFQLREKGEGALQGRALLDFARSVRALTLEYGVPFIVNDDAALAMEAGADGLHIGQDDIPPADLSAWFDEKIVGLSVGNAHELAASDLQEVDYIGTGPVFATQSKDDAGEAIGITGLEWMRNQVGPLPMVAIGGITHENYKACLDAGADGAAVISAIAGAEDVGQAVRRFLSL
ncbi:thiamine phosphate synthase [Lacicoccus alkaliphilus]|uniref:Thiamine-phosphate synthase n=1 Tax=Lacicoccus alkaliphilus DSM 16010 TaxID=1123231 RepID=A0A1M7E7Q7_9BACL|nr:thiamine phosphate synthase [Salinicoccus alkaliphilus]SHL87767.1 thiamine-phosphate pyrophosphorylase [Salinicoccus alkaliphilus DSM 16010]